MASGPIDLGSLVDARPILDHGKWPWTFLAFPKDSVNEVGVPADIEAQEYIAAVQSEGVPVGVWVDTPTDDAYAFVRPEDIRKLQDIFDGFKESGQFPEEYAQKLTDRLLGVE